MTAARPDALSAGGFGEQFVEDLKQARKVRRLFHESGGAELRSAFRLVGDGGDDDDRHQRSRATYRLERLPAILVRHNRVEQDEVGRVRQ